MDGALHVICLTSAELAEALSGDTHAPPLAVRLDGLRMQRGPELYDEFARQLQFPAYFGRNLNALWDLLTDLDWLLCGSGWCWSALNGC